MGCDFYIRLFLEIEHNDGTITDVNIKEGRGYYAGFDHHEDDSDDDENERDRLETLNIELFNRMVEVMLTERAPVTVFELGSFLSPNLYDKYHPYLQKNNIDLSTVVRVIKKERRHER